MLFIICIIHSLIKITVSENVILKVGELLFDLVHFPESLLKVLVNDASMSNISLKTNFFDPDYNRSLPELIENLGYPVSKYEVQTADGYILGLFRIPFGKNNLIKRKQLPVLMGHGLLRAAWCFVINYYSYQNLANVLADEGYDVWLANFRGNIYSQKHVTLTTDDVEFFEFSWDEIALQDLPALIDFILNETGARQLNYIAHSMGTTAMFSLLSKKTEYNDKALLSATGAKAYLPATSQGPSLFNRIICGVESISGFCRLIEQIIQGTDTTHLNKTRLPVLHNHYIAGTSYYAPIHFFQIRNADLFQMYDYGIEGNLRKYNQEEPPLYNLQNISAKTALYSSLQDQLANPQDLKFIRDNLKSIVEDFIIKEIDYSHDDLVIAADAHIYLYPVLIRHLNKYNT